MNHARQRAREIEAKMARRPFAEVVGSSRAIGSEISCRRCGYHVCCCFERYSAAIARERALNTPRCPIIPTTIAPVNTPEPLRRELQAEIRKLARDYRTTLMHSSRAPNRVMRTEMLLEAERIHARKGELERQEAQLRANE